MTICVGNPLYTCLKQYICLGPRKKIRGSNSAAHSEAAGLSSVHPSDKLLDKSRRKCSSGFQPASESEFALVYIFYIFCFIFFIIFIFFVKYSVFLFYNCRSMSHQSVYIPVLPTASHHPARKPSRPPEKHVKPATQHPRVEKGGQKGGVKKGVKKGSKKGQKTRFLAKTTKKR
jgi:hypothetical protein